MVSRSTVRSEATFDDVERLGLSLLHSPSPSTEEGDHSCNIVFVHGLRGHPRTTWEYVPKKKTSSSSKEKTSKHETKKEKRGIFAAFSRSSDSRKKSQSKRERPRQPIYWPAHVLPKKVARARIWTYGYNADVVSGFFRANNKNSILQHANDLMVKLERTLDDDQPIIFVAHSLGGIIVKRVLSEMESSKDESLLSLLNRVFSVVFCGCPHRGAGAATWGVLLSRLATVALLAPTVQLLNDLEIDSQILDMIQNNFLRTLQYHPSIRVRSFLEGQPMTGIKGLDGKIVDDMSGNIGWIKGARHETIDADHREMVREPGASVITSVLEKLEKESLRFAPNDNINVSNAGSHVNVTATKENVQIPRETYPYLGLFYTFDFESVLRNVIDPYPHTCTWISKSTAFKEWVSKDSLKNTFWIHGYPGLGKSVFTKYLLKDVIDSPAGHQASKRCVLYFFCSYLRSNAQSYKGLITSLIYQLLRQRPDLAGYSVSLKNSFGFIEPDINSLDGLQKIFEDLLYWYENPKRNEERYGSLANAPTLYVVVDGLDELNRGEWTRFFETFTHVIHGPKPLFRLLITSRTEPEIEERLKGELNCDLASTDQNASDVAEYIKGTITDFGNRNNFGHENIQEIVSEITKKADGMFLWATLAWSLFTDGVGLWSRPLVQRQIEGLRRVPSGIESLYHRVLSLVNRSIAQDLLAALKWIVAAPEPLTVDEIAVAMSLRARPRRVEQLAIPFNLRSFFKQNCPHLIKIDGSGLIKLVHLSFRSFLLETKMTKDGANLVPNPFHFALKPVNYEIGIDCLAYMTLDDFSEESLEVAKQHVFFPYCHKHWMHHLDSLQDGFDTVFVYFFKLLNFETKELRWYDTKKMIFDLWDRGLAKAYEPATRFGMDINVVDEDGDHFIHHVCKSPTGMRVDGESLQYLVNLGVDINGRTSIGQTLLHRCLSIWHDALCHPDMYKKPDVDNRAKEFDKTVRAAKRPFEIALESATKACRDLLSHPTVDLNATDMFWFSPLSYAIHWGMTDAINMMLDCPYLQTKGGHSALHIAAKEGLYDAVERLLERGADIYGRSSQGQTVLHLAAAGGHYRIMQLLVEHANPELLNAKDRLIDPKNPWAKIRRGATPNGWTALHLAVTSGHDGLVHWLLDHPWINLNVKDKHGRKPIAFAAAFGTKSMLKAFLSRDPTQIAHKDFFGNGLFHMASLGSNKENLTFLYSLEVTLDYGPNKWGNSVADLAPTLAVDEHLHELGFIHSERRKNSCPIVQSRMLQYIKTKMHEEIMASPTLALEKEKRENWALMEVHGDYTEYSLRVMEHLLGNIPRSEAGRQYVFKTAESILQRVPVKYNAENIDNTKPSIYNVVEEGTVGGYMYRRNSANDPRFDEDDALQVLKRSFDCLLETETDRKEQWRRFRALLDRV